MPRPKAKHGTLTALRQLERTKFFVGKVLTAEDFERDQQYVLDHLRRHNRFLHGWGVVAGLGVALDGKAGVVIAPGLAIDCAGNELVVPRSLRIMIPGAARKYFVTIRYCEKFTAPLPASNVPGEGDDEIKYDRVRESVQVELLSADPGANHRGLGPGTPGCGLAHALTLATLSRQGSRWRLTQGRA